MLLTSSFIKPSHKTDQFSYLMQNTLEWSDVTPGGNSFNMTNIADSSPEQNNTYSYNHKVIYTTMIKNSKMGVQLLRLPKDVDYTLCIEIQITDYRLWHKSRISIDKATKRFNHRKCGGEETQSQICQFKRQY